MKCIARARGGGKTEALIRLAAESNGQIVVLTQARALAVKFQAERMGLGIRPPITYDHLQRERVGRAITEYHLDDVDEYVGQFFGIRVAAVTVTAEIPQGAGAKGRR